MARFDCINPATVDIAMTDNSEQAAGGIVWRRTDNGVEVLLVHRSRYDDWAFPKGKLDPGEILLECAVREVEEETGLRCHPGRHLGTTGFAKPDGQPKEVTYWAMEVQDGSFTPNSEVDEIAWVRLDLAPPALSYAIDREFVENLPSTWLDDPDRILLLRHTHAGSRRRWSGDDRLRPLSPSGSREAENLIQRLAMFDIARVATSPAVRCIESIEPLVAERGLAFEVRHELWETARPDDIAALIAECSSGTTLLCTHGNIVASLIELLTNATLGVPLAKGSTWVLDLAHGALAAANYLAPPESSTSDE